MESLIHQEAQAHAMAATPRSTNGHGGGIARVLLFSAGPALPGRSRRSRARRPAYRARGDIKPVRALPDLDPGGVDVRMVAARFICSANRGIQVGCLYICAENDTVIVAEAIITEIRHTGSLRSTCRFRTIQVFPAEGDHTRVSASAVPADGAGGQVHPRPGPPCAQRGHIRALRPPTPSRKARGTIIVPRAQTPSNSRRGSSILSLTRTRNETASDPSMIR